MEAAFRQSGMASTSILENITRELGRRLKKLGWNWSDEGIVRTAEMNYHAAPGSRRPCRDPSRPAAGGREKALDSGCRAGYSPGDTAGWSSW